MSALHGPFFLFVDQLPTAPLPHLPRPILSSHMFAFDLLEATGSGDGTNGGTMLEEDDEILRGVEGKVLDLHTEVVHD